MDKSEIKAVLMANSRKESILVKSNAGSGMAYDNEVAHVVDIDKAASAIAKEMKSSRMIKLSKTQNWFLLKAIDLAAAVLPLEDSVTSEKEFLADYGISKSKVNKELNALYKKLDK